MIIIIIIIIIIIVIIIIIIIITRISVKRAVHTNNMAKGHITNASLFQ